MEPEQPQSTDSAEKAPQLTKKQRRALKKQEKREQRQQAERGKKTKAWAAWVLVVVVIVLGLWWLVARSNSSPDAPIPPSADITAQDHTKGPEGAEVNIIEYSDFQCPACGAYFSIVQQLVEEFGNSIQFAYRHFPLRSIHANAEPAARAAEAAGMQGRFWEMHDALFENQNAWSNERNPFDLFAQYANDIGLDAAQFEVDYNSNTAKNTIRAHETAGTRLGVDGTPTFTLNGERIENPQSYDAFRALIAAIAGEPESDTSPDDEETTTTTDQSL